jgi:hypothetical protein
MRQEDGFLCQADGFFRPADGLFWFKPSSFVIVSFDERRGVSGSLWRLFYIEKLLRGRFFFRRPPPL